MEKARPDLSNGDLVVKNATIESKQYTLTDSSCKGLYLLVHPNGSKYFQARATLDGKRKLIQIGKYPSVSLSEARALARTAIDRVKIDKVDPILERKLSKQQRLKDSENTFQFIAEEWLEVRQRTLAPSTHLKIKQTFNANVYNVIGKFPMKEIDNQMVRKCLKIMEKRGATELMEKARGWIKQVFDFALSDNLITENPIPAKDERLVKHVNQRFPRLKSRVDAGKLLRNLVDYGGSFEVAACVYLQMHFAQRPSELRCAKWVEFDFDNAIWTIPLARSKTRKNMTKPHTVMLSKQAVSLLRELHNYTGHAEYLFASRREQKPLSEATIRKAFRSLFEDYHIVPHGCRHFFSTQANESGLFRRDVIEAALSHGIDDAIRAIYNEATYDDERRKLAQWWSDELDSMRDGAKVLSIESVKMA